MVSLPIDFVSHPKIPFSLRSETSKKKFRYVSLLFRFEAKFGDTLVARLRISRRQNAFEKCRGREGSKTQKRKNVHVCPALVFYPLYVLTMFHIHFIFFKQINRGEPGVK